jgi:hypothetical protein
MIIRKVFVTKTKGQKFVSIPKDSKIEAGDYVRIEKIEE